MLEILDSMQNHYSQLHFSVDLNLKILSSGWVIISEIKTPIDRFEDFGFTGSIHILFDGFHPVFRNIDPETN